MVDSFRPKLDVSLLRDWLGFDEDEHDDAVQFLVTSGCALDAKKLVFDFSPNQISSALNVFSFGRSSTARYRKLSKFRIWRSAPHLP